MKKANYIKHITSIVLRKTQYGRTFVYAVKCGEDDDEERCGVLPSVDEMRKCQSCVTVTTQTLRKAKPRRKCSNHRTYTVRHTSANTRTCNSAVQT